LTDFRDRKTKKRKQRRNWIKPSSSSDNRSVLSPEAFDHALAFLLIVVAPLNAWRAGRHLSRSIESGDGLARVRQIRVP
jgi:hypothetical protein